MGQIRFKSDAVRRVKKYQQMLRAGLPLVTVLMQGNKLIDVFATTELAVAYMEQYPAENYEVHERAVRI